MAMKTLISILIIFSCIQVNAQETMIVYLKDKPQVSAEIIQSKFTDRALARRKKNNVQFDSKDWPVDQSYLDQLRTIGVVKEISRWLNAVKLETNTDANELLNAFDFIGSIQTFSQKTGNSTINKWEIEEAKMLNYGYADTQVMQINVNCLHDLGYTGQGVFVAIIDAGFNGMDTIPYFDSLYLESRLLDTHDFVGGSSVYNYSGHGTAVASTIIAEMVGPDTVAYSGTAKDVDIALYVTEDVSSETQLEEFNLVAALERADSIGVDVVNISLGYFEFDDSLTNYTYSDLDGQTTISALGVTVAASKGIIVVTSAGNSGPNHITTPSDADSILTVGAIDGFGNYAWFSGVGPSFDGRVKPDIVARGGDAWFIRQDGELDYGNGTSFSSPIMAGAVACLIEANPTKTAQEIIQSIRESAHQFSAPDTLMGYGIPDFCLPFVILPAPMDNSALLYPNPVDQELTIQLSPLYTSGQLTIEIVDLKGRIVSREFRTTDGETDLDLIIATNLLNGGYYFVTIRDVNKLVMSQKIVVKH